jgi:hypothetical protein
MLEIGRSTTQAQDRCIVHMHQVRCQRFLNAATLNNDFQNATGVRVSTQIVRNRLHDAGLRSRRPAIRFPLAQCHIQERLQWAQTHVSDLTPVLLFDE